MKLVCIYKRIGTKILIEENANRLGVNPENIFEDDINNLINSDRIKSLKKANRVIIGGCHKDTKLRIITGISRDATPGLNIVLPLIDIQTVDILRKALIENNFEVNLNLIQTYKSLSISEGIRMDPNNPVFLLRGRKLI